MTAAKHELAKNQPYSGDFFSQPGSGRIGIIKEVFEGSNVVDVEFFAAKDGSPDFRTSDHVDLGSLQLHRPPIGEQFGVDTRELNINANTVEIVRHFENGYVEVRMVVHATELLEPADGVVYKEKRLPADPSKWPVVALEKAR